MKALTQKERTARLILALAGINATDLDGQNIVRGKAVWYRFEGSPLIEGIQYEFHSYQMALDFFRAHHTPPLNL